MATVRIYKVAELLGSTSQEVLALLKRDHGIELKSASSTIEEVVARSFVERVARQRNISLPGGDMFAEHPAPAKVQRVSIVNDSEKVMEVIVEDKQLSLAIGKKGQNVRLAAKLTGWKIDIKSEEDKRREVEKLLGEMEGAVASETPSDEGTASEPPLAAAVAADEQKTDND